MKGSSGLGYGNQHSKGAAPKMYDSPAKAGEATKSERAAADGASKETVEKLKNIEAGEKKKSELTDPVKIKRVNAKLNELQPNKKT